MDRPSQNTRSKSARLADNSGVRMADPITFVAAMTPFLKPDSLDTPTSELQKDTEELCAMYLNGTEREIHDLNSAGIPHLQRAKHVKWLKQSLDPYPSAYQRQDASRPWILYWIISALATLGVDVSVYRQRAMDTFAPLQNQSGGFGGGHGQLSHCAASYAAVLCLAQVGGLGLVDRRAMWRWIGQIKQSDGSFAMAVGGETDVRGAYCAMTILALLKLPISVPSTSSVYSHERDVKFTDGLGEWLGRCQTYEGGIGGAPGNEAHGAYVFCCLACLSIMEAPAVSIPRYLDVNALLRWIADRAMAPEGGFAGRTNKLVDACYSHWIGGCWALIEAALPSGTSNGLWNREALVRYTLCCSQTKQGGLRDKPGTRQDGYHTFYSLAGLSTAQHTWNYQDTGATPTGQTIPAVEELEISRETGRSSPRKRKTTTTTDTGSGLEAAFGWHARGPTDMERESGAFDKADEVEPVHPVFVIATHAVEAARARYTYTNSWT